MTGDAPNLVLGWLRFLAVAVLPGYALALALRPRAPRSAGFHALALALGPPVLGVATALAIAAGLAAPGAAWPSFVVSVLAFVVGAVRARRADGPDEPSAARADWIAAALVLAVCAAFPLLSEWWRISSDAWTHEGIVRTIARDGLPPGDPWYAGQTLRYAWIYHVAVGAAAPGSAPDVFSAMAAFAVLAGVATVLAIAAASARLAPATRAWTLVLLVLGLNALFPLFLPIQLVRAMTGEVRGAEAVRAVFTLAPFGWDTVGAFLRGLGGQDFFLNKFLVATPLALALAAYAAWLASLLRGFARPRADAATLVEVALLVAGGGLLHPVVGLHFGALLGALALGSFLLATPAGRTRLRVLVAASFVGLVPVGAFIVRFVRTGEGAHAGLPFDLAPLKLIGLATCLALGIAFAARPLLAARKGPDEDRLRALVAVAALAIALVVRLPGPSPFFTVDKFAYLAWIPLALVAGPAFARFLAARSPVARWALVLALLVPVNAFALFARVVDPGTTVRQPWDRDDFRWMREHLPADAVLLVPPRDLDLGVFGRSDQYYGLDSDSQLRGYALAEVEARRGLTERLFEEGTLEDADRARLEALGRPVYAVWSARRDPFWARMPGAWSKPWRSDAPPAGWATLGRVVRDGADVRVVALVPPRANGAP